MNWNQNFSEEIPIHTKSAQYWAKRIFRLKNSFYFEQKGVEKSYLVDVELETSIQQHRQYQTAGRQVEAAQKKMRLESKHGEEETKFFRASDSSTIIWIKSWNVRQNVEMKKGTHCSRYVFSNSTVLETSDFRF